MPLFDPVQTAFNAGELSRRLQGRVDSDIYKKALAYCLNWEEWPQGSMLMRGGTKHIGTLQSNKSRLLQFRANTLQDFAIELFETKARVYSRQGAVAGYGSTLITNGDFPTNLGSWTVNTNHSTTVWSSGKALLKAVTYSIGGGEYDYDHGWMYQTFTVATAGVQHRVRFTLGSGSPTMEVSVSGPSLYAADTYPSAGTFELLFTPVSTGTHTVRFDLGSDFPQGNRTVDDVLVDASSGAIELTTPYTEEQLPDVQVEYETAGARVFFFHPNVSPRVLTYDAGANTWSFTTITFTSQPAEWTGSSYPGVVLLYQGRLWAAMGNTIWASKSGDIFNFTTGSGDADAIKAALRTRGAIRWMHGQKSLLVGTDFETHSIISSKGTITTSDMQTRAESAYGSATHQALSVGDQVVFLSGDRRKLRTLNYALDVNGWVSRDLTFTSEHITEGDVKEVVFARDPKDTLFIRLGDGGLRACTYDRLESVLGWHRFDMGGEITALAAIDGPEGSYLWLGVQRETSVSLELLQLADNTSRRYLDDWVERVPVGTTVSGLDHLEGLTVQVLVDGAVVPDKTVTSGAITLGATGSLALVGRKFRAKAITLPPEGGNPRGTAQSTRRRHVKAALRVNNSAYPLVNGVRSRPDRSVGTPLDAVEPAYSGDVMTEVLGWEDRGALTIEQDLPFRTEVLALFGVVAANEV